MKFKELRKTGKNLSKINIKVKKDKEKGGTFNSINEVPDEFDKYDIKSIEDDMTIILKGKKSKKVNKPNDIDSIESKNNKVTDDIESGINKIQNNIDKINGKTQNENNKNNSNKTKPTGRRSKHESLNLDTLVEDTSENKSNTQNNNKKGKNNER